MVLLATGFRRRPFFKACRVADAGLLWSDLKCNVKVDYLDLDGVNFTATSLTAAIVDTRWDWLRVRTDHDIIRLQVSMADVVPVHVLSCLEELAHDASDDILA